MPSIPAPPRAPTYGQGDTMLDLIMQQGNARAQSAQQGGNIWANAFGNIGNALAGGIQQYGEQHAVKKRTAALDALFGGPEPPSLGSLVKILGPKDGVDAFKGLRATMPDASKLYGDRMEQARDVARGVQALPEERRAAAYQFARQQLVNSGAFKPEEAPEEFNPDFITQLASYGQEAKAPGTRQVTRRNPDGSEVTEIVPDVAGQAFTSAAPEPKRHMVTTTGSGGRPVQRLATEQELSAGVPAYREPRQGPAPERPGWQWVIRDGTHVQIRQGEAQPGDVPASVRERASSGVERKALGYYQSMDQAEKNILDLAGKTGSAAWRRNAGGKPLIGDAMLSDEQQKYKQALNSFAQAYLRKESGATITDTERNEVEKTFFEMEGDSKAVLAQKAADRERLKENARFQAGQAYPEYYGEPAPRPRDAVGAPPPPPPPAAGGAAAAPTQPPRVGSVLNGYRYKGGDPAASSSWEKE